MKILIAITLALFITAVPVQAQDTKHLKNLKRPRYETIFPERTKDRRKTPPPTPETAKATDNSRFAGTFKGRVTVHYKNKMVTTEATLHIEIDKTKHKNHYDSYILPKNKDYHESTWTLDKNDVRRSVTISGNTVYVTDIIEYAKGGNSQIRTLSFSPDYSALTFMKTEFDDSPVNPATGQIIGRFIRVR